MGVMDLWTDPVDQYREFATQAADSPCFAAWSAAVADDPEVLAWIAGLPRHKQQPNLVFAAARWHGVAAPGPYAGLRSALLDDDGTIRATVLARSTQTNEAGRLATLVPALAQLQPDGTDGLSLVEVGASAGLCLYADRWAYRWRTGSGDVTAGTGPELTCLVEGDAPLPSSPPHVAWRSGIDLHPLDVTDDEAMRWLQNLVWPEHQDRRERLRTAIDIARSDPPHLGTGDLLTDLPRLVSDAARHGPVVVLHSAVIAYLETDDRLEFDRLVRELVADGACHWISNEAPNVLPSVTASGPPVPDGTSTFVLGVDGEAVAWTHGHGRSMRWFGRP